MDSIRRNVLLIPGSIENLGHQTFNYDWNGKNGITWHLIADWEIEYSLDMLAGGIHNLSHTLIKQNRVKKDDEKIWNFANLFSGCCQVNITDH